MSQRTNFHEVDDSNSSQRRAHRLYFWLKVVDIIYFGSLTIFGAFVSISLLLKKFYLILTIVCLLDQKRPEILAKNPKAKVTEVVKEIARCWSLMSKDDRMVYKVEAKRGKFSRLQSLSSVATHFAFFVTKIIEMLYF